MHEQLDEDSSTHSAIDAALEEQNVLLQGIVKEKDDEISELQREIARLQAGEDGMLFR